MNRIFMAALLAIALSACDTKAESPVLSSAQDGETVWIFAQFNVPEEGGGLESYYYYGKVSRKVYEGISKNIIDKGFILVEEVKYWGDDDLLHEYKDKENTGDLVFRIEDIRRIKRVHSVPNVGAGYGAITPPPACDDDACKQEEAASAPADDAESSVK